MDGNQFDRIAKWMSTRRSRREAVRALAAGALGGAAAVAGVDGALAGKRVKPDCCPTAAPKLCVVTCTDTNSDPGNCGGCGVTCASGATCQNGTCACPTGQTNCGGVCINTQTSTANCGSCGHVCPSPANGSATCAAGTCGFTCIGGFAKCGASCVNTSNDAANCGGCGVVCPSGQTCSGGQCLAPQPTCNDNIKNGNETDIDCGGGTCPPCAGGKHCNINADCAAPNFCIGGACSPCQPGQQGCNGVCVNLLTDPNNCGVCGTPCGPLPHATVSCQNGACHLAACDSGYQDCDTNPANGCEVNVSNDSNNCGACGHVCGVGTNCVNGTCMGSQCSVAGDCPPTGNECMTTTCTNGFCGTTFVAVNTPTVSGQTQGDCHKVVCNGSGGTMLIIDDSDTPLVANHTCATGVCNQGNASFTYAPMSTICLPSSCSGITYQPAGFCDGSGNCTQAPPQACPGVQTCVNGSCQ